MGNPVGETVSSRGSLKMAGEVTIGEVLSVPLSLSAAREEACMNSRKIGSRDPYLETLHIALT